MSREYPLTFKVVTLQVQQNRWKVETFSRLSSILLLSSVILPGGEPRRRGLQDQLHMKFYFKEGDLISVHFMAYVLVIIIW